MSVCNGRVRKKVVEGGVSVCVTLLILFDVQLAVLVAMSQSETYTVVESQMHTVVYF